MATANTVKTQKITFWWRWWDEAEHKSSPEKRLAFYDALMRYIFRGEIPQDPNEMENPTGADYAAYDATHYFEVIDWMTDHSSGGAPVGNQNARKKTVKNPDEKQPETTYRNNLKQPIETTQNKKVEQPFNKKNRKEIENEIENEVVIIGGDSAATTTTSDGDVRDEVVETEVGMHSKPTRRQVLEAAALMGISEKIAVDWMEHMRQFQWHFYNGNTVTLMNFRPSLQRFAAKARKAEHDADAEAEASGGLTDRQRRLIAETREALSR